MAYTAVFGVVFVDLKGFPDNEYNPRGRNVGRVQVVHGGVSRNVAENLANVGCPVEFVTMLDTDETGKGVRHRLEDRGVGLKYAAESVNGMGKWLVVMDHTGDCVASISQQPDFSFLEKLIDEKGDEIVRNCKNIVLEVDMCASIAEKVFKLAEKHDKDVFVVVGNLGVIKARPDFLARTRLFILNENEAESLFGCKVNHTHPQSVLEVAREAVERMGMREIVVTLGEYGAVFYDAETGESGHIPAEPTVMVDSTGAGDAFFSGTTAARTKGLCLRDSAKLGAHLAALTIRSDESACPKLDNFL